MPRPEAGTDRRVAYRPEGWALGLLVTRVAGAVWLLSALAGAGLLVLTRRTSHQLPA